MKRTFPKRLDACQNLAELGERTKLIRDYFRVIATKSLKGFLIKINGYKLYVYRCQILGGKRIPEYWSRIFFPKEFDFKKYFERVAIALGRQRVSSRY